MKNIFNTDIETLIEQGRAYVIIPKDIIRNRKLSESARLILIHLLSSDPTVSIHAKLISRWTGIPIKRTRQTVEELDDAGYMRRVHHHRTRKEPYDFQWQITDTAGSMAGSPDGISPLGTSCRGRAPTSHTKSITYAGGLPIALNALEDDLRSRPEAFDLSDKNPASAGTIEIPQNGEISSIEAPAPLPAESLKASCQDTNRSSQQNSTDSQDNLQEIDSKVVKNIIGDPEDYQEYPGYTVGQLDLKCYPDAQNTKMIRTLWEIYQQEKADMVRGAGGSYKDCDLGIDAKTLSAFIQNVKKVPGRTRKVCHILNALTFFMRTYGNECFSDHFTKGSNRKICIKNNFPEAYRCIAGLNFANNLAEKLPVLLKLLEQDAFRDVALNILPVYVKTQVKKETKRIDYANQFAKPPTAKKPKADNSKKAVKKDDGENVD